MSYYHENISYRSDLDIHFTVYDDPGSFVAKHWHNSLEIIYLISGELTCHFRGDRQYLLSAGNFIVVNSRELHSFHAKHPTSRLVLQIPYPFLTRYLPNIDSILFRVTPNGRTEGAKAAYQRMGLLLKELLSLPSENEIERNLLLHSRLFDFLFYLTHFFQEKLLPEEQEKTDKYIYRLGMVTAYVRDHYASDITLQEIADVVSLNPDYFTRFFKKYMGMTFLDYLNSVRLEHIDMDLLDTDLSIQQLTELHGFTNYKLFLKMYRSRFGCSPNEMRKRAKEAASHHS
jgi:AraC-like DNA-binding protein